MEKVAAKKPYNAVPPTIEEPRASYRIKNSFRAKLDKFRQVRLISVVISGNFFPRPSIRTRRGTAESISGRGAELNRTRRESSILEIPEPSPRARDRRAVAAALREYQINVLRASGVAREPSPPSEGTFPILFNNALATRRLGKSPGGAFGSNLPGGGGGNLPRAADS